MRLIDADDLIDEIKNCLWDWKTVDGITATTVLKQTIADINNQPSVDAVPVVRCRDCKWGHLFPGTEYCLCNKPIPPWETHKADWYCGDGERKEDAT